MDPHDFTTVTTLSNETRQAVKAAFDALSNWRDDTAAANGRCLAKVLDQMAATARVMGWPEQAISAMRQYLQNASKMQIGMIDKVMDAWEQQLKSPSAPLAVPQNLVEQLPGLSRSAFSGAMPELTPFAPWTFWLEVWQRNWQAMAPTRTPYASRNERVD